MILVATAGELSLDAAGRELRWRDGSHVELWPARRGDDVAARFDELGRRNPRMDTWELCTRTGTRRRGLPTPGSPGP